MPLENPKRADGPLIILKGNLAPEGAVAIVFVVFVFNITGPAKEFDSEEDAITHQRYKGYWKPYPVEYKRGHSKPDERDEVQLAAQAMCLEEMYGISIPIGA